MKYKRILTSEVQAGDDILLPGLDGGLWRVFHIEKGTEAVCLRGVSFGPDGFSGPHGSYTTVPDAKAILVARNAGLRVRMSESLKEKLGGPCRKAGSHTGPFDSDEEDKKCYSCSWEHVQEFENSVGVVRGPSDYNNVKPGDPAYNPEKVGPEFDVYWEPHNLRYGYKLEDLEVMG